MQQERDYSMQAMYMRASLQTAQKPSTVTSLTRTAADSSSEPR